MKRKDNTQEIRNTRSGTHGFGDSVPDSKYKRYGYDSREEYKKQREENYNRRNQWREQYENKDLSLEKAAIILQLEHSDVLLVCKSRSFEYPKDLIQRIKNA